MEDAAPQGQRAGPHGRGAPSERPFGHGGAEAESGGDHRGAKGVLHAGDGLEVAGVQVGGHGVCVHAHPERCAPQEEQQAQVRSIEPLERALDLARGHAALHEGAARLGVGGVYAGHEIVVVVDDHGSGRGEGHEGTHQKELPGRSGPPEEGEAPLSGVGADGHEGERLGQGARAAHLEDGQGLVQGRRAEGGLEGRRGRGDV
mmetsp:Transcript_10163/g.34539  ORF Transcript_10163/g.34539 Transcript_10163/m.34539 type:complete len:203 (-) Transcript_10163:142-750(-)